jgi:putative ABC transport system ATP-binding protein
MQSAAIMGRSGSGKSTLLHILSTLLKPDRGEVKLFNQNIYSMSEETLESIRREQIGIIFQAHYLFKGMSVFDNINNIAILAGKKIDFNLLKMLEIDNLLDKRVGDISGGQQQRVSIARVLTKKPKIIFADEPTGNLDTSTANLVMDVLNEYIMLERACLFLVTHDLDIAHRTQKVYMLESGKLRVK